MDDPVERVLNDDGLVMKILSWCSHWSCQLEPSIVESLSWSITLTYVSVNDHTMQRRFDCWGFSIPSWNRLSVPKFGRWAKHHGLKIGRLQAQVSEEHFRMFVACMTGMGFSQLTHLKLDLEPELRNPMHSCSIQTLQQCMKSWSNRLYARYRSTIGAKRATTKPCLIIKGWSWSALTSALKEKCWLLWSFCQISNT